MLSFEVLYLFNSGITCILVLPSDFSILRLDLELSSLKLSDASLASSYSVPLFILYLGAENPSLSTAKSIYPKGSFDELPSSFSSVKLAKE